MCSFFASVEAVRRGLDPLQDYLCVAGDIKRQTSVILAATPRLKNDYDIRTGNRLYEVPKLSCIHIVESNMGLYLDRPLAIIKILHQFVPATEISPYSIDKNWINLSGTNRLYGSPWEAALKIQKVIYDKTGLPSSAGLGPNRLLAKLICDLEGKKVGIAEITYEEVPKRLWKHPVEEIWGIGRRLKGHLNSMGIVTLGQLAKTPIERLERRFGRAIGQQLYWHAWGVDLSSPSSAFSEQDPKGFGHGITLLRSYYGDEVITIILELTEEAARRCRQAKMAARTVHLQIGYSKNESKEGFARSRTIEKATNITMELFRVAKQLFIENYRGNAVRTVHVSLSNVMPDTEVQLNLFEDVTKQKALGEVMDAIREKHGSSALLRACSYLHQFYEEICYPEKPVLDEQQQEYINHTLYEAIHNQKKYSLVFYERERFETVIGTVVSVASQHDKITIHKHDLHTCHYKMSSLIQIEKYD